MRVSVVLPTLNEALRLPRRLGELARLPVHEVLVVDGGSTDGTRELAVGCRLIEAKRGRGPQLNAGARAATGDVLLFLHADVSLPPDAVGWIQLALTAPGVVAGAFRTWHIDDVGDHPLAGLLHLADMRSRYSTLPYGDQALFLRRTDFEAVGGFPDQPLMEDIEFSRRLAARGRIWTVPACVEVSGRRWAASPLKTLLLMNTFPMLYRAGVAPERLEQVYGWVR